MLNQTRIGVGTITFQRRCWGGVGMRGQRMSFLCQNAEICILGKLTSWLSACAVLFFILCRPDLFVFLLCIVSGEGSGIRLYRFLIIAVSYFFDR